MEEPLAGFFTDRNMEFYFIKANSAGLSAMAADLQMLAEELDENSCKKIDLHDNEFWNQGDIKINHIEYVNEANFSGSDYSESNHKSSSLLFEYGCLFTLFMLACFSIIGIQTVIGWFNK